MNDVQKAAFSIGVIPVIAIDDAEKAVPLARALLAGGLPAAEVTFRTAAGEEAIRRIAAEVPEVLVGAGTVLNLEQCDRALNAGAKFIVSPGYNEALVAHCQEKGVLVLPGCVNASDMTRAANAGLEYVKFFPAEVSPGYNEALVAHCQEKGVLVLPGCVNASDMTRAANAGLEYVKFFPAEQSGGVSGIKALAPVFPKLNFMPTGGVNTKNLMDYLGYDRIFACGGTWMVKKDLIEGEKWDEITRICKDAVKTMLGFELGHVGINCQDAGQAEQTAKALCAIFGFEYKAGNSSDFAGSAVECNKAPGRGAHGHIAIRTNNVDRAIYHLGLQGVKFDESSRKTDAKGRTKAIYLQEELCGFALHLVQK